MHWKTTGRLVGAAILSCAFVVANAGTTAIQANAGQGDPVIGYDPHDVRMNAAEAEARGQLDRFFSLVLDDDGLARPDSGVKVAVPVPGGGNEVIWVSPFGLRDGRFIGLLANQPQSISDKQVGDVIAFAEAQVRDWYFFGEDGRMYGSYTTRVMLEDMSPAAAEQVLSVLSDTPLPAGW